MTYSPWQVLDNGYAASDDQPLLLFAQTISTTAGLYVQSMASKALVAIENAMYATTNTGGSLVMQLCESSYDSNHIFSFIATNNKSFTLVQ
ncbi:hypothetical protein N7495_005056 [Penicillium taxi]|uniref:uncharacterized protein n=1 Tax=Penicillium taxi TaxID=168475 RepID=UPI0025457D44|nr:uncharacterized protein N7495_005056 [Penicillium taxi]KAJ5893365.1 hypothetical protein N7495_005056 [Penicillium taxi]